jgi:hypothetical protein
MELSRVKSLTKKFAKISSRQLRETALLLNDKDEFRRTIARLFFFHI